MYRFEWNYEKIKDGKSFEQFVEDMRNEETGVNYEQAARLFYDDENGNVVMIELQVPTKDMIDLTKETETSWLDAYEVKHMEDYDASKEIYTGIGNGTVITFDNAEDLMLQLAKELCEQEGIELKTSELIALLNESLEINGDLEVVGIAMGEIYPYVDINCPGEDAPLYIELAIQK